MDRSLPVQYRYRKLTAETPSLTWNKEMSQKTIELDEKTIDLVPLTLLVLYVRSIIRIVYKNLWYSALLAQHTSSAVGTSRLWVGYWVVVYWWVRSLHIYIHTCVRTSLCPAPYSYPYLLGCAVSTVTVWVGFNYHVPRDTLWFCSPATCMQYCDILRATLR